MGKRNPVAKALRSSALRQRIIPSKRKLSLYELDDGGIIEFMTPSDISSLDTHRKRNEILARYDGMMNDFKIQHSNAILLLRMELGVKIAVAESNRERELKGLEPLT